MLRCNLPCPCCLSMATGARNQWGISISQPSSIYAYKLRVKMIVKYWGFTVLNFQIRWPGTILTKWGRVTHIWLNQLTIIGSENGLSPRRRQAIIWTNAGILLNGPLGTKFSEILIKVHIFSFKKILLKMLSGKCWTLCISLNVL